MHSFSPNLLPWSFQEIWFTNRERNPNREFRNADELYIPATLKRMPLFNFPLVWNAVQMEKNISRQNLFIKHQRMCSS
jgi:hypothetical protein